jgi:uracil-DNA glycosylase
MIERLGIRWVELLSEEIEQESFKNIGKGLKASREKGMVIYPDAEDVFKAFKYTQPNEVKVVIVGQDPYYNGCADGLAFSSKLAITPKSLKKIIEEVHDQYQHSFNSTLGNDLTHWAAQGVFLLNRVLTVRQGQPKSHYGKGWETFTNAAIKKLSQFNTNLVFLLWGKEAQEVEDLINKDKHLVIKAEHPSYAARNDRRWDSNHCFITANKYLIRHGKESIEW